MKKAEARSLALSLRKKENNVEVSKNIIDQIINLDILNKYSKIGIYYPIGKEIDIIKLVSLFPNKKFYLPKTLDEIHFIEYKENDILVEGPFNTKEPKGNIAPRDEIECFIIPCVAISGNKRIGYGKGYYDRYLEGYKGYKIGICYKNVSNLDVDMDSFDLILDDIIVG